MWAPHASHVELHLASPETILIEMAPLQQGYHSVVLRDIGAGTRYFFRLQGGKDRPDPASRCQPLGVHGPSEVVDTRFSPPVAWQMPDLRDYILYELHVGSFTPEGTFDAAIPHLDRLHNLGITAVELMPICAFPGDRNWGYDGVSPFAVHSAYGGRTGLLRFVRACHERGIAVVLDVVYNHLGPEGNYLREFGPYFTDRYRTPWGESLNFDGPSSDAVRRYFLENALYWTRDCQVDALRLDAIHAIYDRSAYTFLEELVDTVHRYRDESGRRIYLIAESDLNDSRVIRGRDQGGIGFDAQWSDDFHHCLHTLLTGENSGYYSDFGTIEQLADAYRHGWVYVGQHSSFRQRRFGNSARDLPPEKFIVCSQNHDQAGNRMLGQRLPHLVDWERAKLAAAAVLLSPFTPLLFMGEEYAEPAPFLYFVSHSDEELQNAVRSGRKNEFRSFLHQGEPPDPQDDQTFQSSKLAQHLAGSGKHAVMHALYAELISLRTSHPMFRPSSLDQWHVECHASERVIQLSFEDAALRMHVVLNFGDRPYDLSGAVFATKLLDTAEARWSEAGNPEPTGWDGAVQPYSCVVFGN